LDGDDIEIIGLFGHRGVPEFDRKVGNLFDLEFQKALVQAYDRNGYDRVLVANSASWPDSIPMAAYLSTWTDKVKWMIAHRPGFVAPTMAARMLAVIDRVSEGRCGVHIITGANDQELAADGDNSLKADRYRRSGEYVEVMRRTWSQTTPFDYEGEFYTVKGAMADVRPQNGASIPVFWGGLSPEAVAGAAKHADIYAFPIASLAQTRDVIDRVQAAAAGHGRQVGLCISLRTIAAATEVEAWRMADEVLSHFVDNAAEVISTSMASRGDTPGQLHDHTTRMLAEGSLLDKRLWTEITKATKGTRAVTALVGDYAQVVDAMMDYYDLGVRHFLMSGFDMRTDPGTYGRTIIPMLRRAVAERLQPRLSQPQPTAD
jgi:alkanesulfonate monooxygenase